KMRRTPKETTPEPCLLRRLHGWDTRGSPVPGRTPGQLSGRLDELQFGSFSTLSATQRFSVTAEAQRPRSGSVPRLRRLFPASLRASVYWPELFSIIRREEFNYEQEDRSEFRNCVGRFCHRNLWELRSASRGLRDGWRVDYR